MEQQSDCDAADSFRHLLRALRAMLEERVCDRSRSHPDMVALAICRQYVALLSTLESRAGQEDEVEAVRSAVAKYINTDGISICFDNAPPAMKHNACALYASIRTHFDA